jgi:hypothetical protein
MSPVYTTNLLDLILATATADSLPLHSLYLNDITKSLASDDERPECIQAILKIFSDKLFERTTQHRMTDAAYALNQSKITKWYGLRTLSSLVGSTSTSHFLLQWSSSLPSSIDYPPSLEMLKGNYYQPTPTTVHYLPSAELSFVPVERFAQLFGAKEKWSMDEILPFLEGCVERGEDWEKKAERECQKWARVRGGFVMRR